MKTNILFIFLTSLITLNHAAQAQSWSWGSSAISPVSSGGVGRSVATDQRGNAYVTGTFWTSVKLGTFTLNTSSSQVYLAKYNASGQVLWAFQPTGSGFSYQQAITTDKNANVYVSGYFKDTVYFGAYRLIAIGSTNTTGDDVFLAKFDSSGNVLWAKQAISTPSLNSGCNALATDKHGNCYLCGSFGDSIKFGFHTLKATNGAVYYIKFDPNGNVIWAIQSDPVPPGPQRSSTAITVDEADNSYITGGYVDSISFGNKTVVGIFNRNVYIAKFDSNGNILWMRTSEGPSDAGSSGITTIDKGKNVVFTGVFTDTITFAPIHLLTGSGVAIFLVKYDSNGTLVWAKQSSNHTELWFVGGLCSDRDNNLYICGAGNDTLQFGAYERIVHLSGNQTSTFVLQFDSSGTTLCGSLFKNNVSNSQTPALTSDSSGAYVYFTDIFYN